MNTKPKQRNWKIINEIAGKHSNKSNLIEYLKIDNIKEYGAKKISNRFAKYFAGVGKCFAEKIPKPTKKYYIVFETPAIKQSKSFSNPNPARTN